MELKIKGMGCAHCVARVKAALTEISAEVELVEIGRAVIKSYPDTDRLKNTIEKLGFELISIE